MATKYKAATHCKHGHRRTPENTRVVRHTVHGREYRVCRECERERKRRSTQRLARDVRPPDSAKHATIRDLAEGGVPANWIAETVGMNPTTVRKLIIKRGWRRPGEARRDWSTIWARIRRNPELHALHVEFAPRGEGLPS